MASGVSPIRDRWVGKERSGGFEAKVTLFSFSLEINSVQLKKIIDYSLNLLTAAIIQIHKTILSTPENRFTLTGKGKNRISHESRGKFNKF